MSKTWTNVIDSLCGGSDAEFSWDKATLDTDKIMAEAIEAIKNYAYGIISPVTTDTCYNIIAKYGDLTVADEIIRKIYSKYGVKQLN